MFKRMVIRRIITDFNSFRSMSHESAIQIIYGMDRRRYAKDARSKPDAKTIKQVNTTGKSIKQRLTLINVCRLSSVSYIVFVF